MPDCDSRNTEYNKYSLIASFEIAELIIFRKNEGKGPRNEMKDYLDKKIILNKRSIEFMRIRRP